MGEPLGYTPPCLCCRTDEDEGPRYETRWKATHNSEHDGYLDLFQPDRPNPCAWIHYSCFCEFALSHAVKTAIDNIELPKLCIVCEVKIRTKELLPLRLKATKPRPIWVHRECIDEYYR